MPGLSRGTTGDTAATLARLSSGVSGDSVTEFEAPPALGLNFTLGTLAATIRSIFNTPPTYARGSIATVFDHESILRNSLVGEARFLGLRRVNNVVGTTSEDFTNAAWAKAIAGAGVLPITTTLTNQPLPDGTTGSLTRIQFNLGGGTTLGDQSALTNTAIVGSSTVRSSVWLKTNDGTTKSIFIRGNGSTITGIFSINGTWQRYSDIQAAVGSWIPQIGLRGGLTPAVSDTADVLAWGFQVEPIDGQTVNTPGEYVSVGVKTAPLYHGSAVDAVKCFPYKNGNVVQQNMWARSQELQNAAWSPVNSTTSGNSLAAPDGTLTACKLIESLDGAPLSHILVSPGWTNSLNTYTFSVYAKAGERQRIQLGISSSMLTGTGANARFTLTGDGLAENLNNCDSAQITSVGNGWYRCVATFTPTAVAAVGSFIYLSNSVGLSNYIGDGVSGAYLWGAQLQFGLRVGSYIATAATAINNGIIEPGEGPYIASTTRLGYLSESLRTNSLIQSNGFTTTWAGTAAPVQDTVGPDGATSAWTITDADVATFKSQAQSVAVPNDSNTYSFSIFVKKTSGGTSPVFGLNLNLTGGTPVSINARWDTDTGLSGSVAATVPLSQSFGNYWRFFAVITNNTTGNTALNVTIFPATAAHTATPTSASDSAAATGTAVVYGAQLEVGAFSSSYIPTATIGVGRNGDQLRYTPTTPFLNTSQGSLYARVMMINGIAASNRFYGNDGPSASRIEGTFNSGGESFTISDGSAVGAVAFPFSPALNTTYKVAGTWGPVQTRACLNGGAVGSDARVANLSGNTSFAVGFSHQNTAVPLEGPVAELSLYTDILPDDMLQALTR